MSRNNPTNLLKSLLSQWWLWTAVVIGTIVRFAHISTASVWYDEGFTMMLSPQSPAMIWARDIRDVHPPLYYWVLHYWMLLFGTSEAAARGLSAACLIATIIVIYYLVKRLFDEASARWAALFVAIGPFMIRFSAEARMYGMVSFLLALATFFLVRAVQDGRKRDWIFYMLAMAAAIYTHYYTVFMAVVHWIYLLKRGPLSKKDKRNPLKLIFVNKPWFIAEVGMSLLFLPWLPHALAQFKKVSAGFWIAGPPLDTLPHTLLQFLTYNNLDYPRGGHLLQVGKLHFDPLLVGWHLLVYIIFVGIVWLAIRRNRAKSAELTLLAAWALVPSVIVFLLSLRRAIYLDRYFTFAAIGFYALLAVLIELKWRGDRKLPTLARGVLIAIVVAAMSWGIHNVWREASTGDHQMRSIAAIINQNYQTGDEVMTAELYTYFDLHYYYHGASPLKLLHSDDISGYGVTSLIYDQTNQILIEHDSDLHPASGRVWLVAQDRRPDFFDKVPSNWRSNGPRYHYGDIELQSYQLQ